MWQESLIWSFQIRTEDGMGKMKHIREAIWVTRLVQIFQATSFPKLRGTGGGVNGPGPNTRKELGENNRSGPRDRGTKHLPYPDLLDRRKRGLCFKCDGPYNPMHQCPLNNYKLLVSDEMQMERDDRENVSSAC
ncbi:hypothetical protein V8G54_028960 [Vigna mungo]|uniref:Uncharacterized protein n=1 Tax=Vigna mungo TaxID=3915 RepID=A0AAQ3MUB5_VIGMU